MYFDGASNQIGFRVGIPLVSPEGLHTPISVKLNFEVPYNVTEYKACVIGLQVAIKIWIKNLWLYRDFDLIINQISQKWKVKSEVIITQP